MMLRRHPEVAQRSVVGAKRERQRARLETVSAATGLLGCASIGGMTDLEAIADRYCGFWGDSCYQSF
jgi:hypothetical protein